MVTRNCIVNKYLKLHAAIFVFMASGCAVFEERADWSQSIAHCGAGAPDNAINQNWVTPNQLVKLISEVIGTYDQIVFPQTPGGHFPHHIEALKCAGYHVVATEVADPKYFSSKVIGRAEKPAVVLIAPDDNYYSNEVKRALLLGSYDRLIGVIGYTKSQARDGMIFSLVCENGACHRYWNVPVARSLQYRPVEGGENDRIARASFSE